MYKQLFLFIFSFLFTINGISQHLVSDVNRLMAALDTLETYHGQPVNKTVITAAAEVLSILYHYDQGMAPENGALEPWDQIYADYQKNPLIQELIPDSLILFPDSIMFKIERKAQIKVSNFKKAPRQKILRQLHQQEVSDPADYFSVQRSLVQYQSPAISQEKLLMDIGNNGHPNVQSGLLGAEAAIITGLFEFILERAKDEVLVDFLDGLLNEKAPELQLLFPSVNAEFQGQQFTYSSSLINRLRGAFFEDIQMLSVRLPRLMLEDDYFGVLQGDPVAFNFLALYSMIGLAQQEQLGLEDIVPMTHRFIYDNYIEREKEVNFLIAETCADSSDYQKLINQSSFLVRQINSIFLGFDSIQNNLMESVRRYEGQFCADSSNCPPAPLAADFLDYQAYSLQKILGSSTDQGFSLMLLPQLLQGEMDSTTAARLNLLADYDRFFAQPHSPIQWKSAGLELTKRLSDPWYEDLSITDMLSHWRADLAAYRLAVQHWQATVDSAGAFAQQQAKADAELDALKNLIKESKAFWKNQDTPNFNPKLSLINLNSIAEAANLEVKTRIALINQGLSAEEIQTRLPQAVLEAKNQLILNIKERLTKLDKSLYELHPNIPGASPVQLDLIQDKEVDQLTFTKTKIQGLENQLLKIKQQIYTLEHIPGKINQTTKIRNNAKPILELTELLSQLMYGLYTGGADAHWISFGQLDTLMDGAEKEMAFLGLLQQRLEKVNGIGLLAPNGIAQLARLTIKDLVQLSPEKLEKPDSLKFYYKAELVVNTMNRLMEIPMVIDQDSLSTLKPLIQLKSNLKGLPDVSSETLAFIYYLQKKDHQHAISSLITLLGDLSKIVLANDSSKIVQTIIQKDKKDKSKKKDKGKEEETSADRRSLAIQFLKEYGHFIADLVDARTSDQVKNLLESIADPPGGSRAKRTSARTVGLNSYLGGNAGYETWTNTAESIDESFVSPGVNMPVGIAFSFSYARKNKPEKRTSFSIFASFLDLGGLFTYVPSTDIAVDNTLSFKNIFKPGLQLHWNIPKSPFYMGIGGQYGIHYQTIKEEQIPIRSTRFFFSMGVDVPIKMFYQR